MKSSLRLTPVVLASLAGGWLIVHTLKTSVIDFARVTNESMLPHLRPRQILAISKANPCLRNPLTGRALWCSACEAGKAYVFYDPRMPSRKLVKFALNAPAATRPVSELQRDLHLPQANANHANSSLIWFTQGSAGALKPSGNDGFCYFEGSNREQSVDSRHFGAVPVGEILGKVIYPRIHYKEETAGDDSARPAVRNP